MERGRGEATVSLSSNFGSGRLVSLSTSTPMFLIQDDRVASFLRARRPPLWTPHVIFLSPSPSNPSYLTQLMEKLLLQSFTSCSRKRMSSNVFVLKDESNFPPL